MIKNNFAIGDLVREIGMTYPIMVIENNVQGNADFSNYMQTDKYWCTWDEGSESASFKGSQLEKVP